LKLKNAKSPDKGPSSQKIFAPHQDEEHGIKPRSPDEVKMPPTDSIQDIKLTPEQEKRRRISVQQAARLKGVSEDTFRRHFGHLIEKITPRRTVVRLGDVLD
jgi:hypothetical protein